MSQTLIDKILEAAVRAPSGDNVQPWRFEVSENPLRIKLFNKPEADDSYYNFQQAASYIANGTALENIVIASKELGFEPNVELIPDDAQPELVAQITLTPSQPEPQTLYNAIFTRNTNRFLYRSHPLTDQAQQQFQHEATQIPGCKLRLYAKREDIKALAWTVKINDRIIFEFKPIHRYLFSKIGWTEKEIKDTKDGMPVGTLGLSRFERLCFPLLQYWWLVKFANYVGLSHVIGLKGWFNYRSAAALGMITVQGNDKRALVEGGRAAQRVWLESARQGLAFQPIIGLSLLFYRLKAGSLQELSTKQQQDLADTQTALNAFFGLEAGETMIMGFRVGSSNAVPTHCAERVL